MLKTIANMPGHNHVEQMRILLIENALKVKFQYKTKQRNGRGGVGGGGQCKLSFDRLSP